MVLTVEAVHAQTEAHVEVTAYSEGKCRQIWGSNVFGCSKLQGLILVPDTFNTQEVSLSKCGLE